MASCERYQELLNDAPFGLLSDAEQAELAELTSQMADCPICANLRTQVDREASLLALAAKWPFTHVTFRPPPATELPATEPPATEPPVTLPAPPKPAIEHKLVAPQPAEPIKSARPTDARYSEIVHERTVAGSLWRLVIAALLIVTLTTFLGTSIRDYAIHSLTQPEIQKQLQNYQALEPLYQSVQQEIAQAQQEAEEQLSEAIREQDELVQAWTQNEKELQRQIQERPFELEIEGPGTLVAGAANEYRIRASDSAGNLKKIAVRAKLSTHTGEIVHEVTLPPAKGHTLRLPASLWRELKWPTGPTSLAIVAEEESGGAKASLQQTITLNLPTMITHLALDKPLYRPGETVYFRSLTLDRQTLLPIDRDLTVRFVLERPDGQEVPSTEVRCTTLVLSQSGRVMFDASGSPIQGVACGELNLPKDLPGGDYLVRMFEISPPGATASRLPAVPLASAKLLVNQYTAENLIKDLTFDGRTYSSGERVQLLFTVRDTNGPLKNTPIQATVTAIAANDGKQLTIPLEQQSAVGTDRMGQARLAFTLPDAELSQASVSISVAKSGQTETLVRPIPLTSRTLTVEFFPESGDLIAGVPTYIYFRVTGADGKPADIQGIIKDGQTTIATVGTLTDAEWPGVNQGLGRFLLTARADRNYFFVPEQPARAYLPDRLPGTDQPAKQLPAAKSEGVALHLPRGVVRPGEALPVRLTSVGAARRVVVGVYLRGEPVALETYELAENNPIEKQIDLDSTRVAKGGVLRVTVFEEIPGADWKPVAERLAFCHATAQMHIHLSDAMQDRANQTASKQIQVKTADESGQAMPAILYAAVVNESVIAMANDRTARGLPAHLLLTAELQKPDDLERADFFLNEHPKAAESLDLLLGTQGWRRFAEQAPERVRRAVASVDAEPLLVALGLRAASPLPWQVDSWKLYAQYRPKIEAQISKVDQLEQNLRKQAYKEPFQERLSALDGARLTAENQLLSKASLYWQFKSSIDTRERWIVPIIGLLLSMVVALGFVRMRYAKTWPERRSFDLAMIWLLLTTVIVGLTAWATSQTNKRWEQLVEKNLSTTNPILSPFGDAPGFKTYDYFWGNEETTPLAEVLEAKEGVDAMPTPRSARVVRSRTNLRSTVYVSQYREPWWLPSEPVLETTPSKPSLPYGLSNSLERLLDQLDHASIRKLWSLATSEEPSLARIYAYQRDLETVLPGGIVQQRFDKDNPSFDTLYWNPLLLTDASGEAQIRFDLPALNASYQVLVAGHTPDGRLGLATMIVTAQEPLSVTIKAPDEISSTDVVNAKVVVSNTTNDMYWGRLSYESKNLQQDSQLFMVNLNIPPKLATGVEHELKPLNNSVESCTFTAKLSDFSQQPLSQTKTFRVMPTGYPASGAAQATVSGSATMSLRLPNDLLPGSQRARITIYPDQLAEFQQSLAALLKEPLGCFEQASAANYPNVLILDTLREAPSLRPETARAARDYLERGLARLSGFECLNTRTGQREGFEWFGQADRAHTALSAYALLQLTEMQRVTKVDPALIARTRQFLLNRRTASGGYQHTQEADPQRGFGAAPEATLDAYITWAITESDRVQSQESGLKSKIEKADFEQQIKTLNQSYTKDEPGYRVALAATALLNVGRTEDALPWIQRLKELQKPTGEVAAGTPTIVGSLGTNATIETTALAGLVFLRAKQNEAANSARIWLLQQRDPHGSFGTTQATIQTLRFLREFKQQNPTPTQASDTKPGTFIVTLGGTTLSETLDPQHEGPLTIELPQNKLLPGENLIQMQTNQGSYPVSITWEGLTPTPSGNPAPIQLRTELDAAEYEPGTVAKLTVELKNTGPDCGMTTAIIGLPAGLKVPVDFAGLRTLTTPTPRGGEPLVSYFEVKPRELILYRRGMEANESIRLTLDLVAEYEGSYTGPASRVYLYYDPAAKTWAKPLSVTIAKNAMPADGSDE